MFRNIIFDWSGTLANDLPPVLDATNRLLEYHGRPPLSEQDFRETFRLPFKGFYDEVLPEIPLAELEVLFGEFFSTSPAPVVLLPHAREFLEFCQSKGVRMFILSSARQDFLEEQARDLGVVGFFETIHAGVLDKRHALPGILEAHGLRPDETAFIGDMEHDVETARACGVHSVAVLTGYDPPAKLMKAGPEVVVADLSRLRRLLAGSGQAGHPVPTVGAAVFDAEARVLLVKTWKWSDKWGIPGGKIERGETIESALRREIREETGLEITDVEFVLTQDAIMPPEFYREDHFLLLNFSARSLSGQVVLNEEASEFVWMDPATALSELDVNQPTRKLLEVLLVRRT
jgi:phosphoglycolate phosphatase-like HAD superfamily hydrolase/ADP-ribose pyrophosphatase YjhB (NUDIX family)